MVSVAIRVPHPLVFFVRSRTVANTLSITLVLRMCFQCSARNSQKASSSSRSFSRHSVAFGNFA